MKKILALVLALMMLSGVAAIAEGEYADPVKFSYSFLYMDSATDYHAEALYQYIAETYNVDIEYIYKATGEDASVTRAWLYGDNMPDVVTWHSQTQAELVELAEQELIAPLPDGWEERYPNLYRMVKLTGLYELEKVDGVNYCIPHAVFCNFLSPEPLVPDQGILQYRKDWATKLGFDFAERTVITVSELKAFLEKCIAEDMAGNGATIGLSGPLDGVYSYLSKAEGGIRTSGFARNEEAQEYVFNPIHNFDTIVKVIGQVRDWYKSGLIDPDAYSLTEIQGVTKMASGLAAGVFGAGHVDGFIERSKIFENANPNEKYLDCIGQILVCNDDGTLYENGSTNYYSWTIFNPNIDPEVMERVLAIADFFCTKEGEIYCNAGVKGVDWDYDENGEIVGGVLHPSSMGWYFLSIVSDDFGFANPAKPAEFLARALELTTYKMEHAVFNEYPEEYNHYTSELKSEFSFPTSEKIEELIMGDMDIAAGWQAHIDEYMHIIEPLLEELNEEFFGK